MIYFILAICQLKVLSFQFIIIQHRINYKDSTNSAKSNWNDECIADAFCCWCISFVLSRSTSTSRASSWMNHRKEMHGCLKRSHLTLCISSNNYFYFEMNVKFPEMISTAPIWQHISRIMNDITSWMKWLKMLFITVKKSSLYSIKVKAFAKELVPLMHRIINRIECMLHAAHSNLLIS